MDTEKLLYLSTSLASSIVNAFKRRPKDVQSILVVKLDEIGDMVYSLHCLEALHAQFPGAHITVFCKKMNNILVEQTGCVTHIVNYKAQLHTRYDIQIDLRGNWDTLRRAIKGRCRYYLDRGSIRLKNKFSGGQLHEIITNQDTISWLFPEAFIWPKPKFNIPSADISYSADLVQSLDLQNYVMMHCGARDEARRWPTDRFAALIDELFTQRGVKTLLIGSQNENDINESVVSQCQNAINLAGKTSLLQMAALMRNCDFFVGNESGPLHFAIVEQKPLVALFGPGVKDVFYPLYPNQIVIHHVKEKQSYADKQNSMNLITLDEVLAATKGLNK